MKTHPREWENVSNETKRLNPHLFHGSSMDTSETQEHKCPVEKTLVREHAPLQTDPPSIWRRSHPPRRNKAKHTPQITCTMTVFTHKLCDDDNSAGGGCKALRDAVAAWIGMDDGDPRWRWEYAQVLTRGVEGVVIKIDW